MRPICSFVLAAAVLAAATEVAAGAGVAVAHPQVLTDLVVASPRLLAAVGERSLLESADAGESWRSIAVPGARSIGGAFVLDRSHWWVASASTGYGRVTIARTTNGGASWQHTTLPVVYRDGYGAVHFSFSDARLGWLTVDTVHSAAFASVDLYATRDGGASWRRLGSFPFTGPILFRGNRGFAIAGAGSESLSRSLDGGRTWRPVALPLPAGLRRRMRTLAFVPAKHSVAVEVWFAQTSLKYPAVLLIETSSDGRRWTASRPLTAHFGDYGPGTPLPATALPAGGWLVSNGAALYRSTASRWTSARSSNLTGVTEIAFPSASSGFALLEYGHCREFKRDCTSASIVARTTDGGRSWWALTLDGGVRSAPPCRPSQLSTSAGFGALTGSKVGAIELENVSRAGCSLSDSPPAVTITGRGKLLRTEQRSWAQSPSDLLRSPVRVLAPGERATVMMRWLNWCGKPAESEPIRPVLDVRFARGTELRVRSGQMGPPRCDAPSIPSLLYVSWPLQPQ